MNHSFEPTCTKQSTQMRHLTQWQAQQSCSPFQKEVALPGNPASNVTVTCYDFKTKLLSLLNSSVFTDCSNLDVNPSNPFTKCKSPTGSLNCFNAAKWCSTSCEQMCPSECNFFVPIIFSCDESNLGSQQASLAPLKFATSLLNQQARNKEENWRTLCFIPDLTAFESGADRKAQSPLSKSKRLHSLF